MTTNQWQIRGMDSLFFRESRPHGSVGAGELHSQFPPPARTVLGAIRTTIGDAEGVDWSAHQSDAQAPSRDLIGYGDNTGSLSFRGPWLRFGSDRLYPMPACLLGDLNGKVQALGPGSAVACDLGKVRLPELDTPSPGASAYEDHWLSQAGFEHLLAGQIPKREHIIETDTLWIGESRLGIGRDRKRRTASDRALYQTRHIRPHPELAVCVEVNGAPQGLSSGVMRLGGEGRMASFRVADAETIPTPAALTPEDGFMLMLLTPARFESNDWLPEGFQAGDSNGAICWNGVLNGVELTIHSAAVGKAGREGGWDLAMQQPRAVQSLLPAGSVWFCTSQTDAKALLAALHDAQIGQDQALGRGHCAVLPLTTSQKRSFSQ